MFRTLKSMLAEKTEANKRAAAVEQLARQRAEYQPRADHSTDQLQFALKCQDAERREEFLVRQCTAGEKAIAELEAEIADIERARQGLLIKTVDGIVAAEDAIALPGENVGATLAAIRELVAYRELKAQLEITGSKNLWQRRIAATQAKIVERKKSLTATVSELAKVQAELSSMYAAK